MFRRFTTLLFVLILLSFSVYAQTMKLGTYGISPREAGLSTTDIYTVTYNGLTNVGVGTQMYLKATLAGKKLNDPKWSAIQIPPGSVATKLFGTTKDVIDTSNQVIGFTPDKPGTYVVQVTDGPYTATLTINSATYLGVYNVVNNVSCKTCHSSVVTKWEGTGHAIKLKKGVEGLNGSSYNENCIVCHTTGYDKNAKNDGFDDFPFTFPAVLGAGQYQNLLTQFPEAMKRANIQCESCHGPASGHFGETKDSRIQVTFDVADCSVCHDDGKYNRIPEFWELSKHAVATSYPSGPGRESCVRCHTGKGFAQFVEGVPTTNPYFDTKYTAISCAACHDPHDATNDHQLRTLTVKLVDGTEIKDGGKGKICMNCHQSRRAADDAYVSGTSFSRFGPHYSDAADIIASSNVYTFGKTFPRSNHLTVTQDACVDCHMAEGEKDADGKIKLVGQHTFSMDTPDDENNMNACAKCHGNTLGTSFEDVKFFLNGNGDHDRNGVVEGLQVEIKGLLDKAVALLPFKTKNWISEDPTKDWTKVQLQALYNMKAIYYDRSFGIHNPKFIVSLLQESYRQIGGIVAVEQEESIPTEYIVYQNYPNPFNPTTNIKFSLPRNSYVRLTIYDALGKEVETLVNNELVAGTHTIEWSARDMASGVYFYRIEAENFVKVNKMLLLK